MPVGKSYTTEKWLNMKKNLIVHTLFTPCSSASIVNFGQVNAGWEALHYWEMTQYEKKSYPKHNKT